MPQVLENEGNGHRAKTDGVQGQEVGEKVGHVEIQEVDCCHNAGFFAEAVLFGDVPWGNESFKCVQIN